MEKLAALGIEFWWFGIKQARACLFAGLFLGLLWISPKLPLGGLPRYDFILICAILIQAVLLATRVEDWRDVRATSVFHLLGFALEAFKTSPGIASWAYPEFSYLRLLGVPLYSGFMYAAIASYMIHAFRHLQLRLTDMPHEAWAAALAVAIYANFFTHHLIGDYRWWLTAAVLLLFRKTRVCYRPWREERWMPLVAGFVLIGLFVWIAENVGTLTGAWRYPDQAHGWKVVHAGKASSWALLVIMSFLIAHATVRTRRSAGQSLAFTQAASVLASTAPDCRATSRPPLNITSVGIERMP